MAICPRWALLLPALARLIYEHNAKVEDLRKAGASRDDLQFAGQVAAAKIADEARKVQRESLANYDPFVKRTPQLDSWIEDRKQEYSNIEGLTSGGGQQVYDILDRLVGLVIGRF
jgi:hypothetical protein